MAKRRRPPKDEFRADVAAAVVEALLGAGASIDEISKVLAQDSPPGKLKRKSDRTPSSHTSIRRLRERFRKSTKGLKSSIRRLRKRFRKNTKRLEPSPKDEPSEAQRRYWEELANIFDKKGHVDVNGLATLRKRWMDQLE
jgi:phytoene dehydrogenase-like protein